MVLQRGQYNLSFCRRKRKLVFSFPSIILTETRFTGSDTEIRIRAVGLVETPAPAAAEEELAAAELKILPRSSTAAAAAALELPPPLRSISSFDKPKSTFSRPLSDKGPYESAPEGGLDANLGDEGASLSLSLLEAAGGGVANLVRGSEGKEASSGGVSSACVLPFAGSSYRGISSLASSSC